MGSAVKNGRSGTLAKVDKQYRLHGFNITRTEDEEGVVTGLAYNINSGLITLTGAVESGVFYFKNGQPGNFFLSNIFVILGPSTGGLATDTTHVRVYKNATTGTLISGATSVNVNSNRDFNSTETLTTSLAYKGGNGLTITDGSVHIESLVSPGNRTPFVISEVLKPGNSISVSLEPNDSNTSMKIMVAITGHLEIDTSD